MNCTPSGVVSLYLNPASDSTVRIGFHSASYRVASVLNLSYSDAGLSPHSLCAPAKNPVEAMKLIEEMYAMTKNRAKKQKLIGYMTESDSDKWKASTKLIFEAHARKDVYSVL
jgi:hypothetical protein